MHDRHPCDYCGAWCESECACGCGLYVCYRCGDEHLTEVTPDFDAEGNWHDDV